MPSPLLTPAQVLAHFGYRDRHSLRRLAARGLVERINVGGDSPQGQRWRYRLKELAAEIAVTEEEVLWRQLQRRQGR